MITIGEGESVREHTNGWINAQVKECYLGFLIEFEFDWFREEAGQNLPIPTARLDVKEKWMINMDIVYDN